MSKLFSPREVQKILRNLMTSQKHFFAEKSPKLTIVCFHGQSVEHGQSDESKFGIEMPDMCGYVTGRSKFLNDFLAQNKELRSQRGAKNALCSCSFLSSWASINSNHHQNWHRSRRL